MITTNYIATPRKIILIFIMSIFLIACDKGSDDLKGTTMVVPTLTDTNIKGFTINMAKDYNALLNSLVVAFNKAQKNEDDVYKFVDYRNVTWTPKYIKKKDYYQKVLAHNASYLSKSPSKPLFGVFENLIYIGVHLKNALLDKDDEKLKEQIAQMKKDKAIVNRIIK